MPSAILLSSLGRPDPKTRAAPGFGQRRALRTIMPAVTYEIAMGPTSSPAVLCGSDDYFTGSMFGCDVMKKHNHFAPLADATQRG